MAKVVTGIERKIMGYLLKKYPEPMHKVIATDDFNRVSVIANERRKVEKRLFQILYQLPHWGVGRLFVPVTSLFLEEPTFWKITRVQVDHKSQNMDCGHAFGISTFKGRNRGYEQEIPFVNEHLWRLIPKHEESAYLDFKPCSKKIVEVPLYFPMPPLMSRIEKLNNSKKAIGGKEPMVRMLIKRGAFTVKRQKHPVTGELV